MKKEFAASLLFLMIAIVFTLISTDKVLTFLILGIIGYFELRKFVPDKLKTAFFLSAMTLLMFCNFAWNIFNKNNAMFETFQMDSDSLVTEMLQANFYDAENSSPYGLGKYDAEKNLVNPRQQQYGLQGKFFQRIGKVPLKKYLLNKTPSSLKQNLWYFPVLYLRTICCILTAIVFVLIVFLIKRKYDTLFAFCFYITFLLSPWIVNFARNLYWVEFTWFVPMLIGVFVSLNYKRNINLLLESVGVFIAVLIKSLCGYEYISVILLTMIAFPLVDFIESVFERDWKKSSEIFKSIFVMGIFAVFGFVVALLVHANLRGNGNFIEGIESIYEKDVLRRTIGGKVENFASGYKDSLEASIFSVIIKYHRFYTEVIAGVSGQFFTLISVLPLLIFSKDALKKILNKKNVILYLVFYVSCISWFVLGKSHSFIHTHMNYVLWYFGFVQICFYVIAKQIIAWVKIGVSYVLDNRENLKKYWLEKIYD